MKQMLKKKLQKKMRNNKGFTLLEILVVLTIMGFLIAMVGPKLAGMSDGAVDTVCDSNQNRMVTYLASYHEQTARFPNHLTNLVVEDATNAPNYFIPTVSDQDPDNGAETIAKEFDDRNHFKIHILEAAEAAELKNMGIVEIFNLNSYDNLTVATEGAAMNPVEPIAGVGVAMVGTGYNGTIWDTETEERGWGEPDFFGRMVFGLGAECGLITSGVIANAAHCPGGIRNADNVTYNDYNVVLPRLEGTVNYTAADYPFIALGDITAVQYDEEPDATLAYDILTNNDNLKVRTFDMTEVQENWQFATMCPEGHMYPADDGDYWGVDLGGTVGTID